MNPVITYNITNLVGAAAFCVSGAFVWGPAIAILCTSLLVIGLNLYSFTKFMGR